MRKTGYSQYSKEQGDRLITKAVIIVKLHSNFEEFVGQVAAALRRFLVYRSDGGFSARKLLGSSDKLREVYDSYYKMPDGTLNIDAKKGLQDQPVKLAVQLFLRKDQNDCWKTTVYFENYVIKPDGDTIEVDNTPPIQKIVACADMYAKQIRGPEGDRIRGLMKIFDETLHKSGELAALNLWYYAPGPMLKYSSWRTFDKDREKMTKATNGNLPFDGDAGYPFEDWRIMPFRTMVYDFFRFQDGVCNAEVKQRLLNMEREMYQTFIEINKQLDIVGPLIDVVSQIPGGQNKVFGPLAEKFYLHLKKLQSDPHHFYFVFGPKGP